MTLAQESDHQAPARCPTVYSPKTSTAKVSKARNHPA